MVLSELIELRATLFISNKEWTDLSESEEHYNSRYLFMLICFENDYSKIVAQFITTLTIHTNLSFKSFNNAQVPIVLSLPLGVTLFTQE